MKLLGMILDNEWTFETHINYIANKMKIIRMKYLKIVHSNKNTINMDVVRNLIKATSLQLLNDAGCVYLNQVAKIDVLEKEYNKTVQVLHTKCWNTSIITGLHFNGFISFKSIKKNLNIKAFLKLKRLNNNNTSYKYTQELMQKWDK